MNTLETLFSVVLFAIRQSVQAALWVGAGALGGLVIGLIALWLQRWSLGRCRWSREHPGLRSLVVTFSALLVVPLLVFSGVFAGAGRATANLISEEALLRQLGELALDGATTALASAADPGPRTYRDELELAQRLVEGEETFPIESLAELLLSFSQGALEHALAVYDEQVGITLEGQPFAEATLAQAIGRRFLLYLHGRSQRYGAEWVAPVIHDLRERDVTNSGRATGREMALAIARVHVQRPLARFAFLSFAVAAGGVAAVGLAFTIGLPTATGLLVLIFGSSGRRSSTR